MFKSFTQLICATTLAGVVVAANIDIVSPSANSNVIAGSNITVQIGDKIPEQTNGTAITIDITPCSSALDCPSISQGLGQIIYSAPYVAERHDDEEEVYQNITVTIPILASGPARLGLSHYPLIGGSVGGMPPVEYTDTLVNIVASN